MEDTRPVPVWVIRDLVRYIDNEAALTPQLVPIGLANLLRGLIEEATPGPRGPTDIVNGFLAKHYPTGRRDPTQFAQRTFGLEYLPDGKFVDTSFPDMVFADGKTLTVRAQYGALCTPRDDYAPRYTHVEVSAPIKSEPLLEPYFVPGREISMEVMTYGYVPVEVVAQIIERHGGLKS